MKARVTVTLKSGILDPQGKAIEGALKSLGVAGVASVRQGKVFDIEIDGADRARAASRSRFDPGKTTMEAFIVERTVSSESFRVRQGSRRRSANRHPKTSTR